MPMTPRRRLVRGVIGAAMATYVALGSHVLAGGAQPTLEGVVVPLALATAVSVQLAGRELSWWRLIATVGLSQWLFHQMFMLGAPGIDVSQSGGHAHHGAHVSVVVSDAANAHAHSGFAMTAAHIGAAILTVAAMRRAEHWWVALRRAATRWWARIEPFATDVLAPALSQQHVAPRGAVVAPREVARGPAPWRGPPTFSL